MAAMLLISGGVAVGTIGSSLTSSTIAFRAPSRFPMTAPAVQIAAIDQTSAGQAWARSAFPGGLRRCPQMNEMFVAACEAEIKALSERPAFSYGTYGGPLLVTTIEPVREELPPDLPEAPAEAMPKLEPVTYEEPQALVDRADGNYPALPDRE